MLFKEPFFGTKKPLADTMHNVNTLPEGSARACRTIMKTRLQFHAHIFLYDYFFCLIHDQLKKNIIRHI